MGVDRGYGFFVGILPASESSRRVGAGHRSHYVADAAFVGDARRANTRKQASNNTHCFVDQMKPGSPNQFEVA
jgi:hypothetical protein